MARKNLIIFLSFLLVSMLAFALQAHDPSWRDLVAWFGIFSLVISGCELIVGLIFIISARKRLGRELLIAALLLLISGSIISGYNILSGGLG